MISLLGLILISCNPRGCIGLDIIVVERIVVLVETGRAKEWKSLRCYGLGRCHDCGPRQVDLRICGVRIVRRQSSLFVEDVAALSFLR